MAPGAEVEEDLVVEVPVARGELLSAAEIQKIEQAVAIAERGTSGEIIPMLARRTTEDDSVTFKLLTLFFSLSPMMLWQTPSSWEALAGFFAVSLLLSWLLAKTSWVYRVFSRWIDPQVWQRAELEFWRGRFVHTEKRTGILIFVSLFEHRVVVLADQGISKKLSQDTWDNVVSLLLAQIKKGDLAQGFVDAVQECGRLLSQHFPAETSNANELSNKLRILN